MGRIDMDVRFTKKDVATNRQGSRKGAGAEHRGVLSRAALVGAVLGGVPMGCLWLMCLPFNGIFGPPLSFWECCWELMRCVALGAAVGAVLLAAGCGAVAMLGKPRPTR